MQEAISPAWTPEGPEKFLPCCGGNHEPDNPEWHMDFRGWRFTAPWLCICCGKEICARQWSFGRACGPCDTGSCQSWHERFTPARSHEHPAWYGQVEGSFQNAGQAGVDAFAEHVGATRAPRTEE
ncbi:hypothetical protein LCGC14_1448090 [marine sediment metagenome]|uniref:Uncharacterized protein n=1 Tax=marine sediment metagenome TaxID=412755 RepID=A0A0F9JJE2_9ZZZZ